MIHPSQARAAGAQHDPEGKPEEIVTEPAPRTATPAGLGDET